MWPTKFSDQVVWSSHNLAQRMCSVPLIGWWQCFFILSWLVDSFLSYHQFYSVKWGLIYDSCQDQSHIHSSYSSPADFYRPIFFNFRPSLNDHYSIIIYHPFKKFYTCNHKIWRYNLVKKLQFILKGEFSVFCIFMFFTHHFSCISQ